MLLLAKPAEGTEDISGYYMSEKLDGVRCWWDGGVSRGQKIRDIPWANQGNPRNLDNHSTGLWSRYGNVFYAPDWFINQLPACVLDGELYAGRGQFQRTVSITKKQTPIDAEWKEIQYPIFGNPPLNLLFQDGEIKNANFEQIINGDECMQFFADHALEGFRVTMSDKEQLTFEIELSWLQEWLRDLEVDFLYIHQQTKLSDDSDEAWGQVWAKNKQVLELEGEGLILRSSTQEWTPKRLSTVLKVKPSFDDEAIIVGATAGRTGKTGRYLGMMGNLILDFQGVRFELSGFNNEEREINDPVLYAWCVDNPGKEMPEELLVDGALQFDIGEQITFLYRELSVAGVPKDARFFRSRPQE